VFHGRRPHHNERRRRFLVEHRMPRRQLQDLRREEYGGWEGWGGEAEKSVGGGRGGVERRDMKQWGEENDEEIG
jgi:hypothetical protein